MFLLMKQGEQAWLMSGTAGNHEFARLFWFDDGQGARYRVGQGGAPKLGIFELEHVAVDDSGAHLTWSKGMKSHLPRTWFQLTWE